jgi:hypothetical protein
LIFDLCGSFSIAAFAPGVANLLLDWVWAPKFHSIEMASRICFGTWFGRQNFTQNRNRRFWDLGGSFKTWAESSPDGNVHILWKPFPCFFSRCGGGGGYGRDPHEFVASDGTMLGVPVISTASLDYGAALQFVHPPNPLAARRLFSVSPMLRRQRA